MQSHWLLVMLMAYKVSSLLTGLAITYMGFRLFLADKTAPAGNLSAEHGGSRFSLTGAAPGSVFALFGMAVIALTIYKGMQYEDAAFADDAMPVPQILLPDKPPSLPR